MQCGFDPGIVTDNVDFILSLLNHLQTGSGTDTILKQRLVQRREAHAVDGHRGPGQSRPNAGRLMHAMY